MKRDYVTEILEALRKQPQNGVMLRKALRMRQQPFSHALGRLRQAHKIEWVRLSKLPFVYPPSVWRVVDVSHHDDKG